jgi:hypothetical protein
MNILYLCMGRMLDVYYDVSIDLLKIDSNSKSIFYISDRKHFSKFVKSNADFCTNETFLSEWSITEKVQNKFDENELIEIEKNYFVDSSIWMPLVADRRIFMGKLCKYVQDYKPSLSYSEMMCLIIESVKSIEYFLDTHKPKFIAGFTIATFGEYLIALIAKKKGIRFMQLRHTKINNYYTYTSNIHEEYELIRGDFETNLEISLHTKNIINEYVSNAYTKNIQYEGTIKYNFNTKELITEYPKQFIIAIINDIRYFKVKNDNHYRTKFFTVFFYDKLFRYFNNLYQHIILSKFYIEEGELEKGRFIFYPLHSEPEIAISIFSVNYQNQIEVIRNLAFSLPAGYKLLVKEHPRNIGRRSIDYYKKILQIPNVELANPFSNPTYLIRKSKLVIVLQGFLGFESLMLRTPVISLGKTMYNILPKTLINHVDNIKNMKSEIDFSLSQFCYDENIIKKYLNAIIMNSGKIDLYTVLLKKVGRTGGREFSNDLYKNNIATLTNLLIKSIYEDKTK